jgi:threonine synthase
MAIVVLHPRGRVSAVQERQMTTVLDANVHNVAVDGTFDDCQVRYHTTAAAVPSHSATHLHTDIHTHTHTHTHAHTHTHTHIHTQEHRKSDSSRM